MQSGSNIAVKKGTIMIYRVFDIAEEVDLQKVEQSLRQTGGEARLGLTARSRNAVIVRNAPVRFSLGTEQLRMKEKFITADIVATVWDYGALSIAFQVPIQSGTSWRELLSIASILNSPSETIFDLDALARKKSHSVVELLKDCLKRPAEWPAFEDYIIYFFEEIEGIIKTEDFISAVNLPALILGDEEEDLAESTRSGILENLFQYAEDDLVLVDWNSAVVLEPSGLREIPDVLEFALTHLLEVRYYDDLLDKRLAELYDSVEAGRNKYFGRQFSLISKDANTRFIEFSEFMERMGNSLKVVGDFYLARIFRGALRRFRVHDWQENITRKMNVLAQVSELIQGENNVRRSHLLEIIIIVLILFELLAPLARSIYGG
ncbi:MAG: hypothetical protein JWQ35_9 [Bacteriovoracaceae bacterium]|nr:hypothetical protein [Bacteriovoracaceae bacterium]